MKIKPDDLKLLVLLLFSFALSHVGRAQDQKIVVPDYLTFHMGLGGSTIRDAGLYLPLCLRYEKKHSEFLLRASFHKEVGRVAHGLLNYGRTPYNDYRAELAFLYGFSWRMRKGLVSFSAGPSVWSFVDKTLHSKPKGSGFIVSYDNTVSQTSTMGFGLTTNLGLIGFVKEKFAVGLSLQASFSEQVPLYGFAMDFIFGDVFYADLP